MKSVAVLLDGGYVEIQWRNQLNRPAKAGNVLALAKACVRDEREELFRIFYYDCPPLKHIEKHPISGKEIDFSTHPEALRRARLQEELAQMDYVAYREGQLSFDGWEFSLAAKNRAVKALKSAKPFQLLPDDLKPNIKQKRVDMMIGLDIAWLASRRLVERLILVTADTDFIPAMKFARREGVQVVLAPLSDGINAQLRVHADEIRPIDMSGVAAA